MNKSLTAKRSFTWRVSLAAMAFLIGSVWPLCAQSNFFGGLVIGVDGNPLAGVAVRAKPDGPNTAGRSTIVTQTNDSGLYRFEAVPSGTYIVSAGAEDGKATSLRATLTTSIETLIFLGSTGTAGNRQERVKATPSLMRPPRITVPDDTMSSFDLVVLPSAVSVSGRLEIPAGVTIPATWASLTRIATQIAADPGIPPLSPLTEPTRVIRINAASEFTMDTDVQPDGSFQFSRIPPGTYRIRLNANLGVPPVTITVTDQDTAGITLGGRSTGVRVGGFTDRSDKNPYKGMFPEWVYLIAQDGEELQRPLSSPVTAITSGPNSEVVLRRAAPAMAYFDAAGEQIEALITPVQPDGRFDFLAVPAGEYYIRAIPDTGIPDSKIIVNGDKDIDNVRIGEGARVRGEVVATNSGNRPPEVISLISTKPRGQSATALVEANGSFEFPKMGAGIYRILLDGKVRPTPSETTIGDEDVIIRVETPFSAWVPGRVTFDGPSPPSESLEATRVALTNGYAGAIKPDGSFQIKSDEGEFDFFMLSLPEGYIVKSVVSGGANLLMEPVKVDLRIPTPEILVTLQYKPETTQ